jgi:hypothetical protein
MTGKRSAPTDSPALAKEEPALRFLSERWFNKVAEYAEAWTKPTSGSLVLEQVVEGTPDGTVCYRVESAGSSSRIIWPVPADACDPDMRVTCSWETAVAIASGKVVAGQALFDGKLRVRGNPSLIDPPGGEVGATDPLPPEVRRATTFSSAD